VTYLHTMAGPKKSMRGTWVGGATLFEKKKNIRAQKKNDHTAQPETQIRKH